MKDCKGIIGWFHGHDFKEIVDTTNLPFDEDCRKAIKAVESINMIVDRNPAVMKILDGRVDRKVVGIYCTRCGIEQYLDQYV